MKQALEPKKDELTHHCKVSLGPGTDPSDYTLLMTKG